MIGRTEEIKMLQSLLHEEEPQFIAVFGRRRIGKTYLVRESFHYPDCLRFCYVLDDG